MKYVLTVVAAVGLAAMLTPSLAETPQERTLKAPEKTMGDHGKLPATEKLGNKIPDMKGPRTAASPSSERGTTAAGPKGPPKRMGDEGKLPATKNITGHVPEMQGSGAK